ncbi:hypothetical protein ACFPZ0_05705 [Streptomonospora nanhaiensis]|uniref:hypothetical protein n=1 Tax=Streptomonospora nanhaiensis TaxID=1323731 RepID=UPI001C9953E4|nr:hypothetical protein [Streptomonospora nanhaiensis]MBX9391948.1 hypothetical protein [Streptomonospora nanhaiensis]
MQLKTLRLRTGPAPGMPARRLPPARRRRHRPRDAAALYQQGLLAAEVMQATGLSYADLLRRLQAAGVRMRPARRSAELLRAKSRRRTCATPSTTSRPPTTAATPSATWRRSTNAATP